MTETVHSIGALATETRNPHAKNLDLLDAVDIARLMNSQDATISEIVAKEADKIGNLVEGVVSRLRRGGRLIFTGAGTSGRLGVLDAAECVPTFQSPTGQISGLIAGGMGAMFRSVEGAEDSPELAANDLQEMGLDERDCVIGIAASGRTPYVLGSLAEAKRVGAFTGAVACCRGSRIGALANVAIEVETGPEVLMGSTRLRAGTATKLVLNTITTSSMILLGKTMGDLMVDLNPSNEKLKLRAIRIVALAAEVTVETADAAIAAAAGQVKTAIVSLKSNVSPETARMYLASNRGRVASAIEGILSMSSVVSTLPQEHVALMKIFVAVGIDGGGSSLKLRLSIKNASTFDSNCSWTRSDVTIGHSALPSLLGPDGVAFEIRRRIFGELERILGRQVTDDDRSVIVGSIVVGTSGAGSSEVREGLTSALSLLFPDTISRLRVISDIQLLAASAGSKSALCLIAGTGSIAWWEPDPELDTVIRAGGFGPGVGDEGSGFWIASEGVRAVCMAEDGRGPDTTLSTRLFAAAKLAPAACNARSLAVWWAGATRSVCASLAHVVLEEASAGDAVSLHIRTVAISYLIALAQTVLSRGSVKVPIEKRSEGTVLVAGGGIFADSDLWAEFSETWKNKNITRDYYREIVKVESLPLDSKSLDWIRITSPVDGALSLAERAYT